MRIEKNNHDKNYPYTLVGDWGEEIYCDRKGLIALKQEIDRVLDGPREPQPRISGSVGIGGQMVQRMIDAYEGRRR